MATGDVSVGTEDSGTVSEGGGLVGSVYGYTSPNQVGPDAASVTDSFATGAVSGGASSAIGGLAGIVNDGQITTSYATGSVTQTAAPVVAGAANLAGGFAGVIYNNSVVSQSYASGAVNTVSAATGPSVPFTFAGGFVGDMDTGAQISDAYALGAVTTTGAGAETLGTTTGAGGGAAGRSTSARAAVTPNATAAATIAMAIQGGALRGAGAAIDASDATCCPVATTGLMAAVIAAGAGAGAGGFAKGSATTGSYCSWASPGCMRVAPSRSSSSSCSAVARRDVMGTTLLRGIGRAGGGRGEAPAGA